MAVEDQQRSAARCDRMDLQHRRAQAHARDHGVEGALVVAGHMAHVRRCAAHIEADDAGVACCARGFRSTDHAAGGAGQHRILSAHAAGFGKTAVGLHHEKLRAADLGTELIDVATQDR